MKKTLFLGIMFIIGGFAYSQQTVSLENAIQSAAKSIEDELPEKTKVAVLNFNTPSDDLSMYVLDEIMDILVNHKKLEVVERSRVDAIRAERGYQLSGEVDDKEIQSIGNQLGAAFVITGSLSYSGTAYRFRLYAIDMKNAVRESSSSYSIRNNDQQLAYFLSGSGEAKQASQPRDIDAWKNKWFYLAPIIGFGSYTYHFVTKTTYPYSGDTVREVDPNLREMQIFAVGVQGQLQIFKYFAFEVNAGVGIGDSSIPLFPLVAELTLPIGKIELNAGIGYTIGAGLTLEASIGANIGPGILFAEYIYVDTAAIGESDSTANLVIFGYKFGLGNK
ncbi:hypothetical protein AGMMS49928_25750 [Spirochaetia bacterium]|nr:hypothetical protein AGMMS49928_25750 [Spirochaetia bacterium]